ncbi:MAG: RND transporter [Bacteroidetes bacterium]|nr:MAG: RND transporter [Bacteroidota bacterium]
MWFRIGAFVLKNKVALLVALLVGTAFMGYKAVQVQLSYEFAKAIPIDNPRYMEYVAFKKQFGEDGNVLVLGVQNARFFEPEHMGHYRKMVADIKTIKGVEGVVAVTETIRLVKNDTTEQLTPQPIFKGAESQAELDSAKKRFLEQIFYRGFIYNPATNAYLAGITVSRGILGSADRSRLVAEIVAVVQQYEKSSGVVAHLSGLPLIRTQVADRIKKEMNFFLFGSMLLAVVTLLLFFRSWSATLISLAVVTMGVVWAVGLMVVFGYKISLLTALIPPLIIVIGIPNCIYFLNKYHTSWQDMVAKQQGTAAEQKQQALQNMIGKMGVVTLFCNIAAAVGFAVFALTESMVLKEFGVVAGISIMLLFFISLIFIPAMLSYLPPPKDKHTRYLRNRVLENVMVKIEYWVLMRKPLVYGITALVVAVSVMGIFRLKAVGYIVDDLPKTDKIYTDLKWFEANFGGVLPLEIVVDTRKKGGVTRNLKTFERMDAFSAQVAAMPQFAKPLSLVEGLKFAKQAYYDNDSFNYLVPNEFDMAFLAPYLKTKGGGADSASQFNRLIKGFMDSSRQKARISLSMADVGTVQLKLLLDSLKKIAAVHFDSTHQVLFTGSSITFLEGSRFLINGLTESVLWAFLLIAVSMLLLFRSGRILICALVPNIIPLVVTAGVMGWAGVPLKPSTVLVFSVALGIAIDITIRFLVNYRQELTDHHGNVLATIVATIRHTGISIIYTALVLIAGFVIFMFSDFGGTFSLGWLTSLTLLVATFTNLVFLPVLMLALVKRPKTAI